MTKYSAIFYSFIYLLAISVIASSIGINSTEVTLPVEPGDTNIIVGFLNAIKPFWYLVSFQVKGLSPLFTIIFIYPPIVIIVWCCISFLRGTN